MSKLNVQHPPHHETYCLFITEIFPDGHGLFLFYGYDWLAFAHFVLAILFIGPYKNPVRNKWVIEFGILACIAVIPFALITGQFRGIPLNWRLIDCSFGIVGLATLLVVYQKVITIEKIEEYFKEVRSKDLNENDNQIINQA